MTDDATPTGNALQLSFAGFQNVLYDEVLEDHGFAGAEPGRKSTASRPRHISAMNGQEYMIKGPSITPEHLEVGANEYLAAQLAYYLGLPTLDFRLIKLNGCLCFGVSWMNQGTFYDVMTPDVFQHCINQDAVYQLIPFDCWLANEDRHAENLLGRKNTHRNSGGETVTLLLSDHGHCLMRPGVSASALSSRLGFTARQCIRLDYLAQAITDRDKFDAGVTAIENMSTELIQHALRSVPDEWLTEQDREHVFSFLLDRRKSLRALLNAEKNLFPALQGGTL